MDTTIAIFRHEDLCCFLFKGLFYPHGPYSKLEFVFSHDVVKGNEPHACKKPYVMVAKE